MPQKELEKLQAVNRFLTLHIDKENELKEIVCLAAELCEVPAAVIMLSEPNRRYAYSIFANADLISVPELYKNRLSRQRKTLVITDITADIAQFYKGEKVFKTHFLFYAGVPLVTHDGFTLGYICLLDLTRRTLSAAQEHLLQVLSKRVVQFTEFEFSINILKKQFIDAKDAANKLQSFFESSLACHVLFGKEQEVLAYNKNMSALLQRMHSVALSTGMPVRQILDGEYLADFLKDYNKALTGLSSHYEREVQYKNGEVIWWEVTFDPAYDKDKGVIGVSYNANDITERKTNEQRILQQNESLKEIAHIQSHELRKPLASILGLIEVFKNNNYQASEEEIKMLEHTANDLDRKIRFIVGLADQ